MNLPPLITRDKDVLGGVPVFYGSRVPIQTLIDYLATGETIDAFLDDFPTVTREQAVRFLETIGALVVSQDEVNNTLVSMLPLMPRVQLSQTPTMRVKVLYFEGCLNLL